MKKRILSGAQPTGELHLGNYLGALKNWVALQNEYESFFCIVNMHAITLPQDPKVLKQKTLDLARVYLAAGIDPEISTVFVQSDVSAHAELAWVLNCVGRMGELERMTQFKDKAKLKSLSKEEMARLATKPDDEDENFGRLIQWFVERYQDAPIPLLEENEYKKVGIAVREFFDKLDTINDRKKVSPYTFVSHAFLGQDSVEGARASVGLFTYPILMAADILLYQTDLVPVGHDQKQHLELTRDLAERFNRDFGETFVVPDPYIPPVGARIMSLADPMKKMSKSDENPNGAIFLTDDADTILKKCKRAVTDSGSEIVFDESRPGIFNLLSIYQIVTGKEKAEIEAHFEGKGYGQFKPELAEAIIEFLRPFQEKMKHIGDAELETILNAGAEKAGEVANDTLKKVYENVGLR
jgi:tryptophanyl-tRNA synthetase